MIRKSKFISHNEQLLLNLHNFIRVENVTEIKYYYFIVEAICLCFYLLHLKHF